MASRAGPFWRVRSFCAAYGKFVPHFKAAPLVADLKLEAAQAASEAPPIAAIDGTAGRAAPATGARPTTPADNSPPQEATPADGPTDPFPEFIRHQRTLLLILWRKDKVRIKAVLTAIYKSDSDDNLEALKQIIKRTNRKLTMTEMQQRYEVRRRGEFLELREV